MKNEQHNPVSTFTCYTLSTLSQSIVTCDSHAPLCGQLKTVSLRQSYLYTSFQFFPLTLWSLHVLLRAQQFLMRLVAGSRGRDGGVHDAGGKILTYMWNNVNCRRYGQAKSTTAKTIARKVIIHVSYLKSVNITLIMNNLTVHKTSKLSKHSTACKCVN